MTMEGTPRRENLLRGISENGGVVFYGVDSTNIVREMERVHKTSAVTTAALGHLLTAASMMGPPYLIRKLQQLVIEKAPGPEAGRAQVAERGTVI